MKNGTRVASITRRARALGLYQDGVTTGEVATDHFPVGVPRAEVVYNENGNQVTRWPMMNALRVID